MSRSRPPGASAGPTVLSDLPDDVLVHCFSYLSQAERLSSVCLVSKRFHALTIQPQLLRHVRVECRGAAVLATLAPWLVQHAQRLERLDLWPKAQTDDIPNLAIAAVDCLGALGSAQRLERLSVSLRPAPLISTSWLAALPSVRELEVSSLASSVTLSATDLPALERLALDGLLVFQPGAALPQALTCMRIEADYGEAIPAQFGALPNLRRLALQQVQYSTDSMAPLSQLGRLSRLSMEHSALPGSLSALRTLRFLELRWWANDDDESAALLDAGLGHLNQLTALVLEGDGVLGVPASVGHLPQLQRLYCWAGMADGAALPAGQWLHSIRWLCVHPVILCSNVPLLGNNAQLELVGFADLPPAELLEAPVWAEFWRWAGQHPPLRRVHFDFDPDCVQQELGLEMEELLNDVASLLPEPAPLTITYRPFPDDQASTFSDMIVDATD